MYPRFPSRPPKRPVLRASKKPTDGDGTHGERLKEAKIIKEEISSFRRERIRSLESRGFSVSMLARKFGLQSSQIMLILEMSEEDFDDGTYLRKFVKLDGNGNLIRINLLKKDKKDDDNNQRKG